MCIRDRLRAGDVELMNSLTIIENSFANSYMRDVFVKIRSDINYGHLISEGFEKREFFSNLLLSMLKIGEETGNLDECLLRTSKYLYNEYIDKIKKISSIAEPVLILMMSLLVAFVVFAVSIPMFDSINLGGI